MPRIKSLLKGGLLLALLVLLAIGGKVAGKHLARSGVLHRIAPVGKSTSGEAGPRARTPKEPVREDLVASTIKRLMSLAEGSPYLSADWETQMQIDALLAKLNADELAEVFAALGENNDETFRVLGQKVGAAWMAKDPDAAFRAVLENKSRYSGYLARTIFGTWAQDHPADALAWLDSAEMPEEPANLRDQLRGDAVTGLLGRDFALASAEFLKMTREDGPHGGNSPMRSWASMYIDDPAMRERLLEFSKTTGRPGDYAELNYHLIREWPQEDVIGTIDHLQALKSYLESGEIPAESRPQVDGTVVASAIYREYDRAALEWWMERYGDSREAPVAMHEAMSGWAQKYPDKMLQWFAEQPPSPQRDALASSVVPSLIQQKKFTEAAGTVESIQDPEYRQAAIERLDFLWKEQDASAAAAWRAGLEGGE